VTAAISALGPDEELIDPATFAETFSNVARGGASLGSGLRAVRPGEPAPDGAPPERTLERRVLRALGRDHVEEMAVLPARVGDRILMLLYTDNGRALVSDGAFAALSVLGRRLGRAYERMILTRRHAA